jgi:acetyltransferase-like isoleucine patch superfamily enzyme
VASVVSNFVDAVKVRKDPVAFFRSKGAYIGKNVSIYGATRHTLGSEPYLVSIDDGATISHDVDFITHDGGLRVIRDEYPGAYFYAPIRIGAGAFVGAHAVLIPGVTIGERAIVAAGAVVASDVLPATVVAGVPAREIRNIAEYGQSRRDQWVDVSGLSEAEKRAKLVRRFGPADKL